MGFKKNLKKFLGNPQSQIEVLYSASKIVFVMQAFIFFLVYFFVSASYYDEQLIKWFLPLYVSFIVSFLIFLAFLSIKLLHKRVPNYFLILPVIICIGLGGVFLIPVF